MSADVSIRPGGLEDLPALVAIYNHYVSETAITFDTDPFSVDARRPWFDSFSESSRYRLLVADRQGAVAGYASSSCFKTRKAYDVSVETTIYLDPLAVGGGIGIALYGELLRELVAHPELHRAYGGIALPNDASVALHRKLGFEHIGTYREVGRKFGRYWNVAWYEKDLSA